MEYKEQVQQLDCGIAVIQIMHRYFYDNWLSLSLLKSNATYDNQGINTLELASLASKFGMDFDVYEGDAESLINIDWNIPMVTIINKNNSFHYVVIEKIKNNYVYYCDPTYGNIKINFDEFKKMYTNIVIVCKKTNFDYSQMKNKIKLFNFMFIKESILISIITIILIAISFILSFYLNIVIDQLIPMQENKKTIEITIFFIGLLFIKLSFLAIKNWWINKIELKIKFILLENYINKLLSVKWLKIHHYNESMHLKNIEFINSISLFKSNYLFTIISQSFCLIFSTVILLILDVKIFLITLFFSALLIACSFLFGKKFQLIEKDVVQNSINLQKSFLNIIFGLNEFKLSTTKNILLQKMNNCVDNNIKINIKQNLIEIFYSFIFGFIKQLVPFIIAIMSIFQIWKNNLSLGQLMLFISIFNFFIEPLTSFTSLIIEVPIIKQYLDNLNAFFILEDEIANVEGYKCNEIKSIKIEKLNFSFKEGEKVLKIPKLKINENIHLIGSNGSGKSTLIKIISTLIRTDEITFNNKLIDYFNLEKLREQICYISSNDFIPTGTIYQYITSNKQDRTTNLFNAIDKYNLSPEMERMNLHLYDYIDEFGKNFSTGQKQFIHLLKLFATNYSLILLDEAFENLDKNSINFFKKILKKHLKNKIVIEVSHQKNYIFETAKEINCELFK